MREVLEKLGLATQEQLDKAESESWLTGATIDEVLVHDGVISEGDQLAARSQFTGLPCVDVSNYEPPEEVSDIIPEALIRRLRCVPVQIADDRLYVVVTGPLDEEQEAEVRRYTQLPIQQLLATRNSIDELLQRVHAQHYVDASKLTLKERDPANSAHQVVSKGQKVFLLCLIALVVIACVINLRITAIVFIALSSLLYLAFSGYKFWLAYHSLGHDNHVPVTDEEVQLMDEQTLPIYTILVPLYKEAAVVPRLLESMENLNYPKSKLDIRLLCEEDDEETVEMITSLHLPPHYKLVVVPDSQPKTKPKACNYGLLQADGEYIVIYDAEDRPDPDQLKKAILAFRKSDPKVACIQARLNYFNQTQNILTRWFSIEYSMHFDLFLPGLCHEQVPVPLGGTSNHFVKERLVELGAWDPYNVTEDADLGIRLQKNGFITTMIDSTTLEEANSELPNWIRQRSRWIKGYIQTWLVHTRHPGQLISQVGFRGFLSLNLVLGGTLTLLLNPLFWGLTTFYLFTKAAFVRELFPNYIFYVAASLLFIGNFLFVYFAVAGTMQRGYFHLTRYALLFPVYWGIMSWAAWKGFIQLFTNPFYWEKTVHGLDSGHESAPVSRAAPPEPRSSTAPAKAVEP